MNRYSVWGVIRRSPDGTFRVRVRAVPLADGVPFAAGDELSDKAGDFVAATRLRDKLTEDIKARLVARGDLISSVDSTFEV